MRELRLDLPDSQVFNDLMEFVRTEDEPLVSAQERLRYRLKGVEAQGKVYFGSVLEADGQAVGMVCFHNIGEFPRGGNPVGCWTMVHPDYRRTGHGSRMYDEGLARARSQDFNRVYTQVRETNEPGLRFAERCGFREADRQYKLSLDLSTLPTDMIDQDLDEGVEIVSIKKLQETDPNWAQRLYDLCKAFWGDLPSRIRMDDVFPETPEALEKLILDVFEINLESSFVTVIDGTWAATAWLSRPEEGVDWCYHMMTGVHPDFRRRGLVKAMKRAGFAWGKKRGIRYIHTNQHDTNKPMLKLNMDLGFKIDSCYVVLSLDMADESKESPR